ncbi:MAG: ABC transporter ATP-binding protein [Clostridia bacterium]
MDETKEIKSVSLVKVIGRLLKNVSNKDKKIYVYCALYTFFAAIYPFFAVILPKLLIAELMLFNNASMEKLMWIVSGFFIISALFGFLTVYIRCFTYAKIMLLRINYVRDSSDKLIAMEYKYMEDANFYNKYFKALGSVSGGNNGVEGIYHVLFELPAYIITAILMSVFIGLANIWILLALIINIIVVVWILKKSHDYEYEQKDNVAKFYRKMNYFNRMTNDFKAGKDIRIYNLKERIKSNYDIEVIGYTKLLKQIKMKQFKIGFFELLTLFISDVVTYGILTSSVITNKMGIDDFSMYIAAILALSVTLKTVALKLQKIYAEGEDVRDYFKFLDEDMYIKGGNRKAIKGDTLEIKFVDVSFKYPETEKYILSHLNFTINKGEKLAIVGINGAGKSTIVKLITGLFDVTEGDIFINGISIKEFEKKELFKMFSVVFQDYNILAFTLKENIASSSDEIDEKRVIEALDKVGLSKKVKQMKNGINSMMHKNIEDDGEELSGGESQKVAIARALYKDANMVIMDEPTAALDALAEAAIYNDFSELVKGKTAIYISHRLASTKFCDKIALFDKEGLKEYGNHEELMALKGEYYNMFMVQGKYYKEGATKGSVNSLDLNAVAENGGVI